MSVGASPHWLMICSTVAIAAFPCSTYPRPRSISPRPVWEALRAGVEWIVANVTEAEFPRHAYDVWHDRAVFHFLTSASQRHAYVERVANAVRPGGHVIIATFGPEGPTKCSGLDVQRYDTDSLHGEFGARFRLVDSQKELHQTPFGTTQQFLYCFCVVESPEA